MVSTVFATTTDHCHVWHNVGWFFDFTMGNQMTLPDERYRAIMFAKNLCEDLLDPKKTPRVPKNIRRRALTVLRHFPDEYYLSMLAEARPDIIERRGEPIEPLYQLIRQYELDKNQPT